MEAREVSAASMMGVLKERHRLSPNAEAFLGMAKDWAMTEDEWDACIEAFNFGARYGASL
jgi:hypothetical protein